LLVVESDKNDPISPV